MRATLRLCRFRPRMASLASCLLTPARSARSTAVTFAFPIRPCTVDHTFAVAGGYAQVADDVVTVLAERACDLATVDADKLKADIQGFEEKLGNLSEDDARRAYLYNEIAWCKLKLAQ